MKKFYITAILLTIITTSAHAINFGMYQPEEDYGLIDGWKLNFKRSERDKGKKLIEIKSEDPEEKARMEKEKARYEANKDRKADDEYQMFKFMLDDTVAF